jgi:uncharacterized heparinase superfamily protein
MQILHKIYLYFNTVTYLKSSQVFNYILFFIKTHLLKIYFVKKISRVYLSNYPTKHMIIQKPVLKHQHDIEKGSFKFLNMKYDFNRNIDWNHPSLTKLWLYHLHYFDYILPKEKDIHKDEYESSKNLILNWIISNQVGSGNGWEPYPLSLRIINWIFYYNYFYEEILSDDRFQSKFLNSLYQQSAYLSNFLEKHILANHLFKNAKALFIAGLFFQQYRWQTIGGNLLIREINEQILDDGGHFEQSPMYHMITLEDILDLINFFPKQNIQICNLTQEYLIKRAGNMLDWLYKINQPDGEIPLIGDSAHKSSLTAQQLRKYYIDVCRTSYKMPKYLDVEELADTGFYIFRSSDQYLVIDGGKLGPEYQPGHAHCDLLSFEYSYNSKRFIVDTGLGEYLNTETRIKARSIESHNTMVVNGQEQAEIWQAFRMGRRVRPGAVKIYKDGTNWDFLAEYDNDLNESQKYTHKRKVTFVDQKFFMVDDVVLGDNIENIHSNIHLHPDCEISLSDGAIRLSQENRYIFILYPGDLFKVTVDSWFYNPEFGKIIPSKMLKIHPIKNDVTRLWYLLTPEIHQTNAKKYIDKYHN